MLHSFKYFKRKRKEKKSQFHHTIISITIIVQFSSLSCSFCVQSSFTSACEEVLTLCCCCHHIVCLCWVGVECCCFVVVFFTSRR